MVDLSSIVFGENPHSQRKKFATPLGFEMAGFSAFVFIPFAVLEMPVVPFRGQIRGVCARIVRTKPGG